MMNKLLFILLQGPPDPGDWGDPDVLPINDYAHWLAAVGMLFGAYTLARSLKKSKKTGL